MAVLDKARDTLRGPEKKVSVPHTVKDRLDRGRDRMREGASERNEVLHFWRGNQYVYRSPKGALLQQDTVTDWARGTGKPPHRMRQVRNMLIDVVANEVSAATQRVPSYEISPSKTDADTAAAGKLAERVALYGYDKWNIRDVTERVVTLAVLTGEGFCWPWFDNTIGPFIRDDEGDKSVVGLGDIRIGVLGPNQVYWEPGQRFEESRWHVVERAMPLNDVKQMVGYTGGELKEDADGDEHFNQGPDKPHSTKLVLVKFYLERPSLDNPKGSLLTLANDKQILPGRQYPCQDHKGRPLDELVIHKLSYFVDPDNDRDMGLGKHLLDPQRTLNDCNNKLLEWKNICLIPQIFVTPGLMKKQRLTDEPGAIYEIPQPNENLKWRETPDIPQELFQMMDVAKQDIARISAQNDIPQGVEAGKAIQALIEKDNSRRQAFVRALAEFHSKLMRHCLYLTQRHYTEGRLLKFQGRFGPELLPGFMGADLMGQADVRVPPGSIEPRTRAAVEQKILAYADRGWVTPEAAMAAINGGTAEKLVEGYELDVARANRIIRRIMEGSESLLGEEPPPPEPIIDPETGVEIPQPPPRPSWMPRPFDNIGVHKTVFEDWFKTVDYEDAEPPMKEAAEAYYEGLETLEAEKAAKAAQAEMMQAQGLGMENAARPQDKQMPDSPAAGDNPDSLPTKNQPPSQSRPSGY